MSGEKRCVHARALARLLLVLGALLLVLGLLFDPALVARLHFRTPLSSEALEQARLTRILFCALGLLLSAAGELVRREAGPALLLRRPGAVRCLLVLSCSVLPLVVLDRAARPFLERLTTLYVPDPELGWKHRPGAEDTYWGARVKINSYGMRGPERAPEKPAGVRRVLALGDSVVFGLGLEDDAETLPAVLERELCEPGLAVEVLDAAVCGWSPWQHQRFLVHEGERWQPDLILCGFVLNDATERFGLAGFGGGGRGAQLATSRVGTRPGWLVESGLYLALRELRGWFALRQDPAATQALATRLTPYHLVLEPDSERVHGAWERTLPEIDSILAWCRARSLPLLLVVFPFTIQLMHPEASAPQQVLADFARERGLSCLDLLPLLVAALQREHLAPTDLFYDALHPTPLGNRISAAEIARFVREHSLLR